MTTPSQRQPFSPAFALPELIAVILIVALLVALLLPMADASRRTARIGDDLSNLRRMGTLTHAYAADFNDQMWAFSWLPGNYTTHWPDMQSATTNVYVTASRQAVAIMRERSGLPSQSLLVPPQGLYQHLVLQDYAADALPNQMVISSADRRRLSWAANPQAFLAGALQPQPSPSSAGYRWIFSSSYEVPPSLYDQAQARTGSHKATT